MHHTPRSPHLVMFISLFAVLAILFGCARIADVSDMDMVDTEEAGVFAPEPTPAPPPPFFASDKCPPHEADYDGDGICSGPASDCDDSDPMINPRVAERCDGIDNDCDDKVDEGCEASCFDECTPEGQHCSAGTDELKACANFDDDPCLELRRVECTYGCVDGTCRSASGTPLEETHTFAREGGRPTASQGLKESRFNISSEPCSGSFLSRVEWNADGALCRRNRFEAAGTGFLTPLSCCQRYLIQANCVQDEGELPYQAAGLAFKYHDVGCYGNARNDPETN